METQTVKGPYKPRRTKRNPLPSLPQYFKTVLWTDLKKRLEKASHLCFIVVQNGEVNNVYIKTIEEEQTPVVKDTPTNKSVRNSDINVEIQPTPEDETQSSASGVDISPEEESGPAQETEETTSLPPETPAIPSIVSNPPPTAIKPSDPPVPSPPAPKPATPPPAPPKEPGTEVQAGHRIKARYQNQEVKGTIERVLREAGRVDEFVTILDSGNKVILNEEDLISLLVPEK